MLGRLYTSYTSGIAKMTSGDTGGLTKRMSAIRKEKVDKVWATSKYTARVDMHMNKQP